MRIAHLLRKYNPAEWGGTETALHRLFEGLRQHGVSSVMYCPRFNGAASVEPPLANGCTIRRFKACVPVWGIPPEQKRQLIAVGGNLMSFDLMSTLWRERDVSLVHTHTLGRLGAIAASVARVRRLPLVVSIHGGLLDLPRTIKKEFDNPAYAGFEWGKLFGLLLRSRRLLADADAILTCNPREAALLREQYPDKRVQVQPHSIPVALYQEDHRPAARQAYPQIVERQTLLCVGRIDPVKNQAWLVAQAPEIFQKHPGAILVLAGAATDEAYGKSIRKQIHDLGLDGRVLMTGGLSPGDPRLIGLFQEAWAVILPSISETFGLVLLEAWAAGTIAISSRTSGASALIEHGENGWLFDLNDPGSLHEVIDLTLFNPALRTKLAAAGNKLANTEYDIGAIAGLVKKLYEELIEAKHALRHSSR